MKRLFNDGWEFSKQKPGSENADVSGMYFEPVNLPHDWLIGQASDLYEDSVGFYRKKFFLQKQQGVRYELYFEGAYMDTTLFVNGIAAGEWKYGYSSFYFDITDLLSDGENEIVVRLVFLSPNSRWYSGAGIYRNVYLITHRDIHIVTDSVYVSSKPADETDLSGEWLLTVSAEIANGAADCRWDKGFKELKEVADDTEIVFNIPGLGISESLSIGEACRKRYADNTVYVEFSKKVHSPALWSLSKPSLYDLSLTLIALDGKLSVDFGDESGDIMPSKEDTEIIRFGFRSFGYDTDHGFFINGVHTKICGVCEHHDLGAIGAVFNKSAMRRKFEILRSMGVNAIRTAHNMPAAGLLELADEMGFLVMDEAFDMWEGSKTEYDYGRFFKEWSERDVRSWIRRDRNHPSVFLWSIGNEIYDTHKDEHGQEITRYLKNAVAENDPRINAVTGIGSNYMPWENAQKCADILKFTGYNYGEKYYDEHHAAHPDWHIFGSETSSTVQSRGIYHFPYDKPLLADDDWQCSSLGNSTTSWGAPNPEYCVIAERDHEFSMGQFLWSGFDYIGEPTPYHTRNSYFGQIDTAGFPKDSFYVYKAGWTDHKQAPFVHVFPYWDFNPGQTIDVRAVSNAPEIELFVNGKTKGRKKIEHEHGTVLSGDYRITYEPGEITAVAYDENGSEIARESRHSFGDARKLTAEVYVPDTKALAAGDCKISGGSQTGGLPRLTAGTGDMCFITIQALDESGYPVENANNLIRVNVEGAGWLTGLDNGDSTDTDEYKGIEKHLFSGKMLILIAVGAERGNIKVSVESEGMCGCELTIPVTEKEEIPGISLLPEKLSAKAKTGQYIRKIELSCEGSRKLDEKHPEITVRASIFPDETVSKKDEHGDHHRNDHADPVEWEDVFSKDGRNPSSGNGQTDPGGQEKQEKQEKQEEVIWKVVNNTGIESNIAKITETDGLNATVKALGDGKFRLRCMARCGCENVRVISELDFEAEGLGQATLNPYRFVAGGLYTYSEGDITVGNEHGIATARAARSVAGYENIDFGSYGSDEITISIFNLSDDPFDFELWDGIPEKEGSGLLLNGHYHKKSIWNVYQPETYRLKRRLKGLASLYLVAGDKVHIGGFSFTEYCKVYELLNAGECDAVYGDKFTRKADRIEGIGNNVTVEFTDMDFGEQPAKMLTITGHTDIPRNTIHVIFDNGKEEVRDILEFTADGGEKQSFPVNAYKGSGTIRFVFLPGSCFDFISLQFSS